MSIEAQGRITQRDRAWIPTDETFGARLAMIRWKMGWNIKEAALACGVPAASWRLWEIDGAEPRRLVDIAGQISSTTGVDLGWLIGGRRLQGRSDQGTAPIPGYFDAPVRPISPATAGRPAATRPPAGRPSGHPGTGRKAPVPPPREPVTVRTYRVARAGHAAGSHTAALQGPVVPNTAGRLA